MEKTTEHYNAIVDLVENCTTDIYEDIMWTIVNNNMDPVKDKDSLELWQNIKERLYIFALEVLMK